LNLRSSEGGAAARATWGKIGRALTSAATANDGGPGTRPIHYFQPANVLGITKSSRPATISTGTKDLAFLVAKPGRALSLHGMQFRPTIA